MRRPSRGYGQMMGSMGRRASKRVCSAMAVRTLWGCRRPRERVVHVVGVVADGVWHTYSVAPPYECPMPIMVRSAKPCALRPCATLSGSCGKCTGRSSAEARGGR